MTPEAQARVQIDQLLQAAGWHVCNIDQVNLHASVGVAIREFPLNPGHGFADYLLYVNGKACGVIEAKKEGVMLTPTETCTPRWSILDRRQHARANLQGQRLGGAGL